MLLHADAIPQNGSSRDRARGIDRQNRHLHVLTTVSGHKLSDQSALAGPGEAGNADHFGLRIRRLQSFQQGSAVGVLIFDQRDQARHTARIAGLDPFCQSLKIHSLTPGMIQGFEPHVRDFESRRLCEAGADGEPDANLVRRQVLEARQK